MIVRDIEDIKGTEREVKADTGTWTSRRMLLRSDGMGFSFHETIIHAGTETLIWYKNHLEAVYCVGGEGEIEDLTNGETHQIRDGIMYALNGHEKHYLRAKSDLRMICVFTPPLTGKEDHDADGVYALMEE
ncbi:ectoine synthase [Terasakiella pusilla]|jgi:L-ectoine synthase|uniref:ectoine synthase n=1 Tax=Terasakiella pusilla TaxID=64973 RepID=UPI00048E8F68|nr:ectoine synthase [Terasakiella pusilla]